MLTEEETVIYRVIAQSQNEGIWVRTIRQKAKLGDNKQFWKAISRLEKKGFICRCVNGGNSKFKKIYVLTEYDPSR